MFAYCPTINQKKCGFPNGTSSKEMKLLAGPEKATVSATELKYLPQGFDPELGIGIGSEDARYDSCYYEITIDPSVRGKWIPSQINVRITEKSDRMNAYIYGGTSRL